VPQSVGDKGLKPSSAVYDASCYVGFKPEGMGESPCGKGSIGELQEMEQGLIRKHHWDNRVPAGSKLKVQR
jgi:hypothetical protein